MRKNLIMLLQSTVVFVAATWRATDALQLPTSSSSQQQQSNRRQFINHVIPSFITATAVAIFAPPSFAASENGAGASKTTSAAVATTMTTMVGQKAPTFTLPNSRGEGAISLDQLVQSKKWTVLYFYPGAFTQGKLK